VRAKAAANGRGKKSAVKISSPKRKSAAKRPAPKAKRVAKPAKKSSPKGNKVKSKK
jgi:hypothetical protein